MCFAAGFHVGNSRGIRGAARVRRAPLLRRVDAVRRGFVRRQTSARLPDLATGARRLRGPDHVPATKRFELAGVSAATRNRQRIR